MSKGWIQCAVYVYVWTAHLLSAIVIPSSSYVQLTVPSYPKKYRCPDLANIPSQCRLMSQCSMWWPELMASPQPVCSTDGDFAQLKTCCPGVVGGANKMGTVEGKTSYEEITDIPKMELDRIAKYGVDEVNRIAAFESRLSEHQTYLFPGSPAYSYYSVMKPSDTAAAVGELGLMVTVTTQKLKSALRLSNEAAGIGTQRISVRNTALSFTCVPNPICQSSMYRSFDGSCNNQMYPLMGSSNTHQGRYLSPRYDDGVWEARNSGMPNTRLVRVVLAPAIDRYDTDTTLMLMQFGQYIDHDLSHVPSFRLSNGSGIACCTPNGKHLPRHLRHPHCFPLDILPSDPFYSKHKVECINFVRSLVAPRSDCSFGYAEHLNQVTHWLDGSATYGSTDEQARALRELSGGWLKSFTYRNRSLLPLDLADTKCIGYKKGFRCFKAGDSRVNQLIGLTALQTIWMREHNRIAEELGRFNPSWDDEYLFQEARRIVIAELQHITYNEYLPVLLGRQLMEAYGLLPRTSGYFNGYNASTKGEILNEFSAAAYRYGHSMVKDWFDLVDESWSTYSKLQLRDWFNNPHALLRDEALDSTLRGLVMSYPQASDKQFVHDLTNMLFKTPESHHGGDLISFNIWRGRDHGLPGYNFYRERFGLKKVRHFEELLDVFDYEFIDKLTKLYKSPDDVDLYIAGMAEKPIPGGILGHTFSHMIAGQFLRLKEADRFFYELGGQPHSFTLDQLDEIRKVSMATIICLNSDNIRDIQPLTFRPASTINPRFPCSAVPKMSLSPWKSN